MGFPDWPGQLGVALIAIGTILLVATTGSWLKDWQTLAGALLALLGAWWTVRRITVQIQLAEEHERARIRRSFQARLAALPLTLSALCDYLSNSFTSLEEARAIHRNAGNSGLVQNWSPPQIGEDLPVELQRFLEATDDKAAVALVTGLFQQLQTLGARMRDLTDPVNMQGLVGVQTNLVEYQFQVATIYSMVEALFPFSRGQVVSPPQSIGRDKVVGKLDVLNPGGANDATFQERLASFTAPHSPAWPRA